MRSGQADFPKTYFPFLKTGLKVIDRGSGGTLGGLQGNVCLKKRDQHRPTHSSSTHLTPLPLTLYLSLSTSVASAQALDTQARAFSHMAMKSRTKKVKGAVDRRILILDNDKCTPHSAAWAFLRKYAGACGNSCIEVIDRPPKGEKKSCKSTSLRARVPPHETRCPASGHPHAPEALEPRAYPVRLSLLAYAWPPGLLGPRCPEYICWVSRTLASAWGTPIEQGPHTPISRWQRPVHLFPTPRLCARSFPCLTSLPLLLAFAPPPSPSLLPPSSASSTPFFPGFFPGKSRRTSARSA